MRGRVSRTSLLLGATGAAALLCGLALAPDVRADIKVKPRIQLRQTWTDTANLDAVGERQGDHITTISPGVEISGVTERVQAFVDYTLNGLIFWEDSGLSDIRHDLAAALNTEIVRDRFFIDVRGRVSQQFQDFTGQVSNIQANFTQNRATVQNYSASARWREELNTFAVAQLSYTYTVIQTENELLTGGPLGLGIGFDSTGHRGDFNLTSGRQFDRLTWNWNTSFQVIDRDLNNSEFEAFESIADLSYELNRRLTLLSSIGYEDIRDDTLAGIQRGVVWDIGARFQPGPRTVIEARGGRRFDDWVFSGRLNYAFTDKDRLEVRYAEDLTVPNRNEFFNFAGITTDDLGIPIVPGNTDEITGRDIFLTDAAFRLKRASLTLERALRRSSLSLRGFWELRDFGPPNPRVESYGAFINGLYKIDVAQSVGLNLVYRHNDFGGALQSDDFIAISPSYTYAFTPNLSASMQYNFTQRLSEIPGLERSTNAVSLLLTMFF